MLHERLGLLLVDPQPFVDYYQRRALLRPVPAVGSIDEIAERIERIASPFDGVPA